MRPCITTTPLVPVPRRFAGYVGAKSRNFFGGTMCPPAPDVTHSARLAGAGRSLNVDWARIAAIVPDIDRLLQRAELQRVVSLKVLARHGDDILQRLEAGALRFDAVLSRRQAHELESTDRVGLDFVLRLARLVRERDGAYLESRGPIRRQSIR